MPLGKKDLFILGCVQGAILELICLSVRVSRASVSVCMCKIRRFCRLRELYEVEYGLTRGTCFVARRPEVVAVAGLLWISWCVLGAAGFRFFPFFFLQTHTACCKYEAALPHLPLY